MQVDINCEKTVNIQKTKYKGRNMIYNINIGNELTHKISATIWLEESIDAKQCDHSCVKGENLCLHSINYLMDMTH